MQILANYVVKRKRLVKADVRGCGEVLAVRQSADLTRVIAVSSGRRKYIADTRNASHREYKYEHVASA